ncbi:MAG: choice-of-anchor Q domain-containing protein [Verrucomicrobiota bacterium]
MKISLIHAPLPAAICVTVLAGLLTLLPAVRANTLYVDAAANGNNNGNSWTNAYPTLQYALANATSGDEIWVAAGTYYPDEGTGQTNGARSSTFQLASGVAIYGGFPADGSASTLSDRKPAPHRTILSGDLDQDDVDGVPDDDNAYHIVTGTGTDDSARLDGFTIVGGKASGGGNNAHGAGLYCNPGNPTIANCSFVGNACNQDGAAAYFRNSNQADFVNCGFQGNAAGDKGGAIYNNDTDLHFVNCSFQGNDAVDEGGAIYNTGAAMDLANCIIWNNRADGSTTDISSSVFNLGTTPVFTHCLVDNSRNDQSVWRGGIGQDNGDNIDVDPEIAAEIDPSQSPAVGGVLFLQRGSPAINAADGSLNSESIDLAGNNRQIGSGMELGAYEFRVMYVDPTAAGNGSGTGWINAFNDLQTALADSASEYRVAEGIYYPDEGFGQSDDDRGSTFRVPNGAVVLGGFPAGGGGLSTRDPILQQSVLSGDLAQDDSNGGTSENALHVVTFSNAGPVTTLDGFVVSDGLANGVDPNRNGGGMFISGCSPQITDCLFKDNSADQFGGGLFLEEAPLTVVSNCVFRENTANTGAGVFVATPNNSPIAVPTLLGCIFEGNMANVFGGGLANLAIDTRVINCVFKGNYASSAGGAVRNSASDALYVNCSFQGNSAGNAGGAIDSRQTSAPTFRNCIVWHNRKGMVTTDAESSVSASTNSSNSFTHCLVQNIHPAGVGNLDGTDMLNDPRFLSEANPALAPSTGGSLRLQSTSPLLNIGDNAANTESNDRLGRTRVVNGTIDLGAYEFQGIRYVDAAISGGSADGSTWSNAYADLHSAIADAPSEIWVAEGNYYPDEGPGQTDGDRSSTFPLITGVSILGGFPAGGGDGTFAARAHGTFVTTLSGDLSEDFDLSGTGDNAFHVVTGSGADSGALVDGVTVTAGRADGSEGDNAGGALYCLMGSPLIANCQFKTNFASIFGGALYLVQSEPTFVNSTFAANESGAVGGVLYASFSDARFINCVFQGNYAASLGGGLYLSSSSPLIINGTMQGNHGDSQGGAIFCTGTDSEPSLVNTIIWNNRSGASTSSDTASIRSGTPTFSHSLVQGYDLSGSGNNFDGTDAANNPLFGFETNPLQAPSLFGNLRLTASSPMIDIGDNGANIIAVELDEFPRILDGDLNAVATIDLGAYEFAGPVAQNPVQNLEVLSPDSGSIDLAAEFSGVVPGTFQFIFVSNSDPGLITFHGIQPNGVADLSFSGLGTATIVFAASNGRYTTQLSVTYTLSLPEILYVDQSAPAGGNGYTWNTAFRHLQDALGAGFGNEFIHVAEGIYYPDEGSGQVDNDRDSTFLIADDLQLFGGFPTGGDDLANRDSVAFPTILSGDLQGDDVTAGNADNAYQVVTVDDGDASNFINAGIVGFTIEGGLADTNDGNGNHNGAGINSRENLGLDELILKYNFATGVGGALYQGDGTALINNCLFDNNTAAANGGGGAIRHEGEGLDLIGCNFSNNRATRRSGDGGAIRTNDALFFNLWGCSFNGNSAGDKGGAIFNQGTSGLMGACTFRENAAASGGALASVDSLFDVDKCLFEGNTASVGDGGAIHFDNIGPSEMYNCAFQGNRAASLGGAVYNEDSALFTVNCSFQGNAAQIAGAIAIVNVVPTYQNCIFWNNAQSGDTTGMGASIVWDTASPGFSNCLVQNWTIQDLNASPGSGSGNMDGTDLANNPRFIRETDPLNAPQAGGDLRLQSGTPAYNAGNNGFNDRTVDLAGNTRRQNGTIDLGAYERGVIYVDPAGGPTRNGRSWGTAFLTLQDALAGANQGQHIWIAAFTYYPDEGTGQTNDARSSTFLIDSDLKLYGGVPATGSDFDSRAPETWVTTLSGDLRQDDDTTGIADNAYHIVTINDGDDASFAEVLADGVTITAGHANLNDGNGNHEAAGIDNRENLTLKQVIVRDNIATDRGAGLLLRHGASEVHDSTFSNNECRGSGGAIRMNNGTSLVVKGSDFIANKASDFTGDGGAILKNNTAALSVFESNFSENSAGDNGGAVYSGGVASGDDPLVDFTNCSFQGNMARDGGAIYNNSISPIFESCLFSGNSGSLGGAMVNGLGSSPILVNCTLSGNIAGQIGGAICNVDDSSSTFANCILWNNAEANLTTTPGASIASITISSVSGSSTSGPAPTYYHCLVANWDGPTLNASGDGGFLNMDGTDAANDPRFTASLDPFSAPSIDGDFHLTNTSPGLERGANEVVTTTDLDGNARIQGCLVDLGAYEHATNIPRAYCDWIAALYPGETDPDIIGILADPNGDGISNGQAFIGGANPLGQTGSSGTDLTTSYTEHSDATSLLPEILVSFDLETWEEVSAIPSGVTYTESLTDPLEQSVTIDTTEHRNAFLKRAFTPFPAP